MTRATELPPPLRGPAFGSYAAEEVAWLLTDLSAHPLEAPIEERERLVQSGAAHYAQSLPVEYRPGREYELLFRDAVRRSAWRVASAVGVLTELILAERGPDLVIASLARAGTPVGVLVRRWAAFAHRLNLPHYSVSIVRDRGIDPVALDYLCAHHDPMSVVFVDGWTGKGAIARELAAAVAAAGPAGHRFVPELAVLADPGRCVRTFGTRDDFLIPSACLNSTVSGLVSRTVLNDTLIAPGRFHGAKFYRELADDDVSSLFVDAVTAEFPLVAGHVADAWPAVRDGDRRPDWSGWAAVTGLAAHYDVPHVNLVKPGVGETTRVLLRRVPWRVLVRPDAGPDIEHIRLLAAERDVPVEEVPGLAYACVGLVRPQGRRA